MSYSYSNKITITDKKYNYLYRKYLLDKMISNPHESVGCLLLDSSLIIPTQYNYKVIECGDYMQVYRFKNIKQLKGNKEKKILLDNDNLYKKENINKKYDLKIIEYKNILRSKFQLQRIVKSNENEFKTFITLTFSDNIKDVEFANKQFDIWRTKIKSIKKDFKYVCVPEFQKRGAVHYHLLTNLEIDKEYQYTRRNKDIKVKLIIPQKDKTSQYDVKYWSYGFTSVYPLKNINVVGYITKYMTKDIDNRLWGKRKYLCSHNLIMPKVVYLDSRKTNEYSKLFLIENLYTIKYKNSYLDYDGNDIECIEYKI